MTISKIFCENYPLVKALLSSFAIFFFIHLRKVFFLSIIAFLCFAAAGSDVIYSSHVYLKLSLAAESQEESQGPVYSSQVSHF